ncbi:MAG: hypothetical protein KI786_14105, partial [Mameliella sp.]|nr:hypothetical protein [Phaeodactylibacter sp.]
MRSLSCLLIVVLFGACSSNESPTRTLNQSERMEQPDLLPSAATPKWAERANIYEVNIRQYTPSGTIAAFEKHL